MIRTMTLLLMAVTASDVCHGQTLEWARQLGTSEVDSGVDISVDNHGSVYIVGNTEGAFAGAGIGDSDGYIGKYSELGTLEWIRQIGTTAFDNARSVSADGLGSVYVSGHTRGGFSGENAGSYDGFLAKYNEDGESVWTLQIGTSEIDEAWGEEKADEHRRHRPDHDFSHQAALPSGAVISSATRSSPAAREPLTSTARSGPSRSETSFAAAAGSSALSSGR